MVFVFGLLYLVGQFLGPSMLLQMTLFHSLFNGWVLFHIIHIYIIMCVCVCVCMCICGCSVTSVVSLYPHGLQPTRLPCLWDSTGKNTGVGYHALLNMYICMCVCIYLSIYHIFIHRSMDIYLGWSHLLAMVGSAAVNNGMHVSFQIMVFSGYIPRSGIAGSYSSSIVSFFKGTSILFSIGALPM